MSATRNCMSDRIKNALIERICDGVYAPGERLVELQIAKEFNTSQAPVREALSELEAMRIVVTQPYKGTRVREITRTELEECLRIRAVLESLAAELVGNGLQDKIGVLKEKADLAMEAAQNKSPRQYALINLDFHRTIVEASGNATLLAVWETLAPEVRMIAHAREHAEDLVECAKDHFEIIDAFADGDNRFAGKLLRQHAESVLAHNLKKETV